MKKIKVKTSIPCFKKFNQNDKIKKINLKPQKDAGKTELKLPRSGFVHLISVLSIVPPKKKPELCDQALAVSEN